MLPILKTKAHRILKLFISLAATNLYLELTLKYIKMYIFVHKLAVCVNVLNFIDMYSNTVKLFYINGLMCHN